MAYGLYLSALVGSGVEMDSIYGGGTELAYVVQPRGGVEYFYLLGVHVEIKVGENIPKDGIRLQALQFLYGGGYRFPYESDMIENGSLGVVFGTLGYVPEDVRVRLGEFSLILVDNEVPKFHDDI